MQGMTINEITVGDRAEFTKTLSEFDVYQFAGITGDLNPAHINQPYSKGTVFKGRIVHGMLLGGMISGVIGMQLPGPGAIYVKQDLSFKAPVTIGETVTACVEVREVDVEKNRVVLGTYCANEAGKVVVEGVALVSPRKR